MPQGQGRAARKGCSWGGNWSLSGLKAASVPLGCAAAGQRPWSPVLGEGPRQS